MTLTKAQQYVVDRMKEGWSLRLYTGQYTYASLQQGRLGYGGVTEKVNLNTFSGLEHRKVICRKVQGFKDIGEFILVSEPPHDA